jgi:UDP-N-acetylglucosamine 2-epimerase (non-hydrolysing)
MPQERLSVLALFGTRPELIKLFPVLGRLGRDARFHVTTVSTSQHREMIDGLLQLFSLRPDHDLNVIRPDQSLVDVSTATLRGLDPILREHRPDLMVVQGDTTSAFSGALTAFYHRIPVAHVEAGLRSFDRLHPYPEEINRRLISIVAELHFAPTESGERNLVREGVDPARIFVTGNTAIDALREIRGRNGHTLDRHLPPELLAGRRLVLVTAHRRESFDGPLAELCSALKELVSSYPDLLVVYPVHLNPNVRRAVLPVLGGHERIRLLEPLPYETFVEAMSRSHLIVTDSGGVQEEAPSLGKPVLVFRKVTERGEGVAARGAIVVGLSREGLLQQASRLLEDQAAYREMTQSRDLYGDGQASRRIVQAILHHFGHGDRPERFTGPPGSRT